MIGYIKILSDGGGGGGGQTGWGNTYEQEMVIWMN